MNAMTFSTDGRPLSPTKRIASRIRKACFLQQPGAILKTLFTAAMAISISACSANLPELPNVPFFTSYGGEISLSGELTYADRAAIYTGSIARLTICNDSAAPDCGDIVAQHTMRVGGLSKPIPFNIMVPAEKITAGPQYSLWVTVTGATGRVSWVTIEPFTINASLVDAEAVEHNLGSVFMMKPDAFRNSSNQSTSNIATQD